MLLSTTLEREAPSISILFIVSGLYPERDTSSEYVPNDNPLLKNDCPHVPVGVVVSYPLRYKRAVTLLSTSPLLSLTSTSREWAVLAARYMSTVSFPDGDSAKGCGTHASAISYPVAMSSILIV